VLTTKNTWTKTFVTSNKFTSIHTLSFVFNNLIGFSSLNMIKCYNPIPILWQFYEGKEQQFFWLRDELAYGNISLCYLLATKFNKQVNNNLQSLYQIEKRFKIIIVFTWSVRGHDELVELGPKLQKSRWLNVFYVIIALFICTHIRSHF
jgi:hypothetical protein